LGTTIGSEVIVSLVALDVKGFSIIGTDGEETCKNAFKFVDNWTKDIDTKSTAFISIFEASKKHNNIVLVDELFEDFANHFPDLKSYNQEDAKKIILNLKAKKKIVLKKFSMPGCKRNIKYFKNL
jgi:hypothetical protein